jgi:hypothetical protein
MNDITDEIVRVADKVVQMSNLRDGRVLDFSEASLTIIEEMLEEAAEFFEQMTHEHREIVSQDHGCYILEVARREFGGRYTWFEQRNQPVLVVGKPKFRVALMTWDKVLGRLAGDAADNIPFFYSGFAERVRNAEPDDDALYI